MAVADSVSSETGVWSSLSSFTKFRSLHLMTWDQTAELLSTLFNDKDDAILSTIDSSILSKEI